MLFNLLNYSINYLVKNLVEKIGQKDVIPVIGRGACRIDGTDLTFDNWLAERLCQRLKIDNNTMNIDTTKLSVNTLLATLLRNNKLNAFKAVPREINTIITTEKLPTSTAMRQLAEIANFPFFLTTTFDPILELAIQNTRYGNTITGDMHIIEHYPDADRSKLDLPYEIDHIAAQDQTCIYYLFGKYAKMPHKYARWDEDAIHFALHFHRFLSESDSVNISTELQEKDLLLIGLNFTDWLTRFFLSIVRQGKLSDRDYVHQTIADSNIEDSLVIFFDSVSQESTVTHAGDPTEFIDKLHSECMKKYGKSTFNRSPDISDFVSSPPIISKGDIFLSYAREDLAQAQQLKTTLEKVGCKVWLDQERLRAGDMWENTLISEVNERCSVFISLISKNSDTPRYCQVERTWACKRAESFGARPGDFFIPVKLEQFDVTYEQLPKDIQFIVLPNGVADDSFARHILDLQTHNKTILFK